MTSVRGYCNLTLLRHSDDSISVLRTSDVPCVTGAVHVYVLRDVDASCLHSFIALSNFMVCPLRLNTTYTDKGTQNCIL